MAWVKVPPEHHPIFRDALPKDSRVTTLQMFGGVAAKVKGHIFAGLFGRSTMVWLPEPLREEALALEGAEPFDPMGNGRRTDKVMLPERFMEEPEDLRHWLKRAFEAAAALPPKVKKTATAGAKNRAAPGKATRAPPKVGPKGLSPRAAPFRRRPGK
jgi:hypothetical protein